MVYNESQESWLHQTSHDLTQRPVFWLENQVEIYWIEGAVGSQKPKFLHRQQRYTQKSKREKGDGRMPQAIWHTGNSLVWAYRVHWYVQKNIPNAKIQRKETYLRQPTKSDLQLEMESQVWHGAAVGRLSTSQPWSLLLVLSLITLQNDAFSFLDC